jgi:peptidoglycan/LPS O-acetylase OafA/YrhL
MTGQRDVWLDGLRGLCAFAVCAGHLRGLTLADYGTIEARNPFLAAFYFATGLGHQAVVVFFVLSGYFVGGSVFRHRKNFSFPAYLAQRLLRLWIVLLPALLVTYLCDIGTASYKPEVLNGACYTAWNSGPTSEQPATHQWSVLLGTLGFVHTILVPVYGTNYPLWSLANEFWYYMLYPLFLISVGATGQKKWFWRVLCGFCCIGLLYWLPHGFLEGLAIWLLGPIVARLAPKLSIRSRWPMLVIALMATFGVLMLNRFPSVLEYLPLSPDLLLGLATAGVCLILARWGVVPNHRVGRAFSWLCSTSAAFSYSLYVVHFPVLLLLASCGWLTQKAQPTLLHLFYYALALMVLTGSGVLLWLVSERHTQRVRSWLGRNVSRLFI